MVKKRRIAHQPSFKMIPKEESEDDINLEDEEETDHLKDVLQELRVKSEIDGEEDTLDDDEDDDEYSQKPHPTRRLTRRSALREVTPPTTGRAARKRKRRDEPDDAAFHHTYVMKLFDRSVDLAQFNDDTPLYPICRAWMANQPRNSSLLFKQRTPTPEPPTTDEEKNGNEKDNAANKEGEKEKMKSKDDSDSDSDAELVKDTYKLPAPIPLSPKSIKNGSAHRIPSPMRRPVLSFDEFKQATDGRSSLTREALLQSHLRHWNLIREAWHKTSNHNEERYQMSDRILSAIYRKAQKAFE